MHKITHAYMVIILFISNFSKILSMLTSRTKKTTTNNILRHLLLFAVLIGFSFSNLNIANINSNKNKETILKKLESRGMSFLENEKDFLCLISMINNKEIKSLKIFNNTLTIKLTEVIYKKVLINYENLPIEKINTLLKIIIIKISKIPQKKIYYHYFGEGFLNLIEMYFNNNYTQLNFNRKITIVKIIFEKKHDIKIEFIRKYTIIFE